MAARFWVGGTGTWDAVDTTHWSATSGGAGGASVPGAADTVTFDGSSGGGTVTLGYSPSVTSITMGSFTGTFNDGGFSPTVVTFSNSGAGTRTLALTGSWTITGSNGTVWNQGTTTNLTVNASSSTLNFTYSGSVGTRTMHFQSGYGTINVSAGSDIIQNATSNSVVNLNFTGFSGQWLSTGLFSISGNLTLSATMTVESNTGTITFNATSSGKTITTNGVQINRPVTFNGSGGGWTLQDDLNMDGASPRALTFVAGTLNTNAKTVTCGTFVCNDNNVKTLTITNSTINITSTVTGTQFNVANGSGGVATNLTVNATGSTINFTGNTIGSVASHTFSGGGKTWGTLVFNGPMRPSISFSNTFANLTFIGAASTENRMTIAVDQTVTGTWTVTGTAARRILVMGAGTGFEGTQRTVTAGAVSFAYVDFQDIRVSGAASPASGTSLGDCFNNTNINFDAPRTLYWVGNSGSWSDTSHWSTTSGGASGSAVPIPQDTAIIDANSITLAGQTITEDVCRPCKNLNMSAVLNAPTFAMRSSNVQGTSFYGDVTFASTVTVTGNDSAELCTRTTANWNPAGITFPNSWVIRAANGGIVTQLGDYISTGALGFTLSLGKLMVNGYNNQTKTFQCHVYTAGSGRNQEIDFGSGVWSLTDNGTTTVLNVTSTALVVTPNTGYIKLTGTSANTRTLAGGGYAWPKLVISGTGTNTTSITGNNTWEALIDEDPTAHTVLFAAGSTQIIKNLSIYAVGTISFRSSTPGSTYTISDSSGLVSVRGVDIKDCIATGGAYFEDVNGVDSGNNTGWNFVTRRISKYPGMSKMAVFGGTRPYKKVLYGDLHHYRKLGG